MHQNIILGGVGGQGILTIARAISFAAIKRGMHVKQAEVHGMSQRGGAVDSHLRIGDEPLHSDLIPTGQADLVVSTEPLESLRYAHLLGPGGVLVSSSNAFVNIGNYPPIEEVLDRIAAAPLHVLIDANHLARGAGSGRAANIVMVGAASLFLEISADELDDAVVAMFADKGEKVVDVNRRAFRFGRNAATAYRDGLERGGTPRAVRHWVETLPPESLAAAERPDAPPVEVMVTDDGLSGAEAHAVERTLLSAYEEGRRQLYEPEVYQIVQLVGAITPPHHVLVGRDEVISEETLMRFPGDRVVLKIVSPDIVHKSDVHGVVFCRKEYEAVKREIDRLSQRHRSNAEVIGVLVVEHVETGRRGFGEELFVGVRATREFGPVVAAGIGGIDTEYLARAMQPGAAVAKALATETTPEEFFDLFSRTAAYDMIAGRARGHQRIVSDDELLRCFRAFISLACRFCVDRGPEGPDVGELEVNPFAFRHQRLIPLDGRGRLTGATPRPAPRPSDRIDRMLEPRSMAVLGVSSTSRNFGRIILGNVTACGFDREHLYVIKGGETAIDGVRCVPSIDALPEPVDLLVIAAAAENLPGLIEQCTAGDRVGAAIMIPGGVGETPGSEAILDRVRNAIRAGRDRPDGGPVFLGPNCLGVQSRPGRYDTFFVTDDKLDKRRSAPGRGVALLSQSGAFIVSRLSRLETLDCRVTVSIGNQADLTIADTLGSVGRRSDIHTIGLYVEGFNDLDGLDTIRAVEHLSEAGRTIVFYKAGRTEQGRDAAAGHTASVVGDYDICEAGAAKAGALVANTFAEFEQLVELSAALHDVPVGGTRIAFVSNAGFETVGAADRIRGPGYELSLPPLSDPTHKAVAQALDDARLSGLVAVRNPLDLTPMAGELAYGAVVRALLAAEEIDAVVVACVPMTPALATTELEIEDRESLAEILPRLAREFNKPLTAVVDAGPLYEPFVARLREGGLPVFRLSEAAVRSFGRYLNHRADAAPPAPTALSSPSPIHTRERVEIETAVATEEVLVQL